MEILIAIVIISLSLSFVWWLAVAIMGIEGPKPIDKPLSRTIWMGYQSPREPVKYRMDD